MTNEFSDIHVLRSDLHVLVAALCTFNAPFFCCQLPISHIGIPPGSSSCLICERLNGRKDLGKKCQRCLFVIAIHGLELVVAISGETEVLLAPVMAVLTIRKADQKGEKILLQYHETLEEVF